MLAEIRDAEDRDHAVEAAKRFDAEFRPKWPKAADKISDDLDRLLTFYDFPGEHWRHLKTSNPIWSRRSPPCGRLRTKVTKAPAREQPVWPWRSSSSSPLKIGGGPSTDPTSSPSSGPAPRSARGYWSRTNRRTGRSPRNQRGSPIHMTILLGCGSKFQAGDSLLIATVFAGRGLAPLPQGEEGNNQGGHRVGPPPAEQAVQAQPDQQAERQVGTQP